MGKPCRLVVAWLSYWVLMGWSDVISTSGNIDFDVDDAGVHEARLNETGLAIGGNAEAEVSLHVQGNGLLTGTLTIGSVASNSSNLYLSGVLSQSLESVNANVELDKHTMVMAGNSSDNLTLTLPGAWDVDGRLYQIKKTVSENEIMIQGGGKVDGSPVGVSMSSGNLGSLLMISSRNSWHILENSHSEVIETLFYEDFEDPSGVATNAVNTSGQTPTNWVRATAGFGASRHGLIDRLTSTYSPDDPTNDQAYAFRYTNSGITTAEGVIGTLQANVTYQVSFDVVMDNGSGNLNYIAQFLSFPPATSRNDVRSTPAGANLLASTSGSALGDGSITKVVFEYTVDPATDAGSIGDDITLRFRGATFSATIDEVIVRSP